MPKARHRAPRRHFICFHDRLQHLACASRYASPRRVVSAMLGTRATARRAVSRAFLDMPGPSVSGAIIRQNSRLVAKRAISLPIDRDYGVASSDSRVSRMPTRLRHSCHAIATDRLRRFAGARGHASRLDYTPACDFAAAAA